MLVPSLCAYQPHGLLLFGVIFLLLYSAAELNELYLLLFGFCSCHECRPFRLHQWPKMQMPQRTMFCFAFFAQMKFFWFVPFGRFVRITQCFESQLRQSVREIDFWHCAYVMRAHAVKCGYLDQFDLIRYSALLWHLA